MKVASHLFFFLTASVAQADITPARRAELENLVRQDCGSCHGLTLRGGLGKPLTQEALAARPDTWLKAVILNGVPGTAMPPWKSLLSPTDTDEVIRILRSGDASIQKAEAK